MVKGGSLVTAAIVFVSSVVCFGTAGAVTNDGKAAGVVEEAAATVAYGGAGVQGVSPARLLDTRPGATTIDGTAAGAGPVGVGGVVELLVAGRGGVPDVGAGAVVLNVTATSASEATHITAFPTGDPAPKASNLNLAAGDTTPNLVVVKIGRDGKVSLRNNKGTTHLIADVAGWFPEGSGFSGLSPARLLDTRPGATTIDGVAAAGGAVGAKATTTVPIAGRGGVPSDAGAVVVNLTATGPTAPTHITAYPAGQSVPNASNLNLGAGQTRPNLAILELGDGGAITLRNNAGQTHLIADVLGWFPPGTGFGGLTPARLLDTRPGATTIDGQSAGGGVVGAKATITVPVAGRGGVPGDAGAVVLNVTTTGPTAATHVTVFPAGEAPPKASNLNAAAGQTVANLVIAKLGPDGSVSLRNNAGQTHLIADVLGWFPDPTTAAQTVIGLKSGTVLAGAGDVTAATWTTPTTGTATIARSGDVPPIGGHLAVNPSPEAPDGFMGTVTGSTPHPDGSTTVTVTAANLQDAFVDLDIDGPITPAAPTVLTFDGAAPAGRAGVECEGVGTVSIGTVSVSLGALDGDFTYSLRDRRARLEGHLEPSISVTGGVAAELSCKVEGPKVPLGAVGALLFEGRLFYTFSVSAAASYSLVTAAPVTVGFEYDDGNVTSLNQFELDGSGGTSGEGSLSGSLSVGLTGEMDGKVFGVAGATIELGSEVTGTWELPACRKVDARVFASIGAEIGRWGIGWDVTVAEVSVSRTLYKDAGCDDGIGNPDKVSGLVRYDVDTDVFDEIPLPGGGTAWRHYADAFGSMTYRLEPGGGSYSGELDWTYSAGCHESDTAPSLHIVGSDTDVPGTWGYQPPRNSGDGWSVDSGELPPLLTQVATDLCDGFPATTEQLTWGTHQAGLCGDLFVEDLEGVLATAKFAEGTIAGGGGDNYGEGTSYRCKVTYRITADDDTDHDGIPDDADATPNVPDPLPT